MKHLLFFTRVQWKERIVTSSFVIGITLQSFVFCLAVVSIPEGPRETMVFAFRSGIFTAITIMLYSAMSNISNEFKFDTIKYVLTSPMSFSQLLLYRSFANAIVTMPAVLFPVVTALLRYPHGISWSLLMVGIFFSTLYLGMLCFVVSSIVNAYKTPIMLLPWLKYLFVFLGLGLFPLPGLAWLYACFPNYWILQLFAQPDGGGVWIHAGFWGSSIAWMVFTRLVYVQRTEARLRTHVLDARMGLQ